MGRLMLLLLAIAGLMLGTRAYLEHLEAQRLGDTREWPSFRVSRLSGAEASLRTTCRGRNLRFQLLVTSSATIGIPAESLYFDHFTVVFRDSAGFKIFDKDVPLSEITRSYGGDGSIVALTHDGTAICIPKVYDRLADWTLTRSIR